MYIIICTVYLGLKSLMNTLLGLTAITLVVFFNTYILKLLSTELDTLLTDIAIRNTLRLGALSIIY
jgi:hypothetical protein